MTCHKVMSTELFRSLKLRERGFAIEPEILLESCSPASGSTK